MSEIAVRMTGLGKRYRVYRDPTHRILERLTLGRVKRHRDHWVFRDLNLEVPRGTAVGIVGVNGAGKSTLLKVVSGTSREGGAAAPPRQGTLRRGGWPGRTERSNDRRTCR